MGRKSPFPSARTGEYLAASRKFTVTVKPFKTKLMSVKARKGRKVSVRWKKNGTGYELPYSSDKKFKKAKTLAIGKKKL